MTVNEFLSGKAARTERALHGYVDMWDGIPVSLREAVEYSLFAGGKRLRPALALGAAEIVAGDDAKAMPAACALEMIHTYSLIHDDLPAMDDDDLRRGKPTSHKMFGEAVAILAGDALLTMAFDVAAQTGRADVVREIAQAAGVSGMVGGQVIDLESEDKQLALDALRQLHAAKTGALIRVSVRSGALLADASSEQMDALTLYGEHVGLAFQIADDILDVTGTEELLGKPIGSDEANSKSTYPSLVGLEQARELAEETVTEAVGALNGFGPEADVFRALARFIVDRDT
ncbi:MAG: polyprenyl synthetase family protein [bacterium]|nr:polyprenyl synthetase family protein [bacterium]